jgi:hypothetical protein
MSIFKSDDTRGGVFASAAHDDEVLGLESHMIGGPNDHAQAMLNAIRAALPADCAPDLPLPERVQALVAELEQLKTGLCQHTNELNSMRNTIKALGGGGYDH